MASRRQSMNVEPFPEAGLTSRQFPINGARRSSVNHFAISMQLQNENATLAPPRPSHRDAVLESPGDHELASPRPTPSRLSVVSSALRRAPNRTISKLQLLAERANTVATLFNPQMDHKRSVLDDYLKQTGKDENDFSWHDLDLRGQIVWLIHSRRVQLTLLTLLIIDVLIVVAELVMVGFRDCRSTVALGSNNGTCGTYFSNGSLVLSSASATLSPQDFMIVNSSGTFPAPFCGLRSRSVQSNALHQASLVLFWISNSILFIFAIEIITLFACLLRRFFTFVYVMDTIIVTVSIVFAFTFPHDDTSKTAMGLVIFLRCWRFARILHGYGLTFRDFEEQRVEIAEAKEEGQLLQMEMAEQYRYIGKLERDCRELKLIISELMLKEETRQPFVEVMSHHQRMFQKLGDDWEEQREAPDLAMSFAN